MGSIITALVPDTRFRQTVYGSVLSILICYNAWLTLGFGLIGSNGNSIITGSLLLILPVLLFLLGNPGALRVQFADLFFAGLLITALLSSVVNVHDFRQGWTKEYALLALTFAGYVACRPIDGESLIKVQSAFERVTALIVLLGAVFTAAELLSHWDGPPGKPFVFGFDAAGTYFMEGLGFLIIALVAVDRPRPGRTLLISALIFLPAAIFAAAMVRFSFVALAGSLLVAAILTEAGKRWHVAAVTLAIFLAAIVGLSVRYRSTKMYAGYILEETVETKSTKVMATPYIPEETIETKSTKNMATPYIPEETVETKGTKDMATPLQMPSCRLAVNMRNSIAIREALAKDAVYLIPTAGLLGLGLDNFMKLSCIKAHEIHVSILQAAVEFGWLGCAFLFFLAGAAIYQLVPLARQNGVPRFVLCSLVFAVSLSMAHGRISRDSALFALLGCAVGVGSSSRSLRGRVDSAAAGYAERAPVELLRASAIRHQESLRARRPGGG